ncbi:hypothetical protein Tco_0520183 [Tanacetum coccineum]
MYTYKTVKQLNRKHKAYLLDAVSITAALIDVNAAQSKLVLLENFNENYSKCLRLLYKVNAAEGVNVASEEVSTAELEFKGESKYGYGFLVSITIIRADGNEYTFKESDYTRLNLNDIEDIIIVIKKRVEDVQLGVESYQTSLNITESEFIIPRINDYPVHTMCPRLFRVIYETKTRSKLRLNKVGTYYKELNNQKWTRRDVGRSERMMRKIKEILKERRQMRSRMLLYIKGKENGKLLVDSVLNGPFKYGTVTDVGTATTFATVRDRRYDELTDAEKIRESYDIKATNIFLQGLPQDIYNLVNHHEEAKHISDKVKLLIEGSKILLRERESKLYDEFDMFTSVPGEIIHSYYLRFAQLINNIHTIRMTMRPIQVNTKFINHLQLEWRKFFTDVKLAKDLNNTNFNLLYAYLR